MRETSKRHNEDVEKVLKSRFCSFYKGVLVLKAPIGLNGISFGLIILGSKVRSKELLLHEYGHVLQLKKLGFWKYLFKIFIPSVTASILDKKGRLPYDYYGSPWEAEADTLAHVARVKNNTPWSQEAYTSYKDLLKLFRKRR